MSGAKGGAGNGQVGKEMKVPAGMDPNTWELMSEVETGDGGQQGQQGQQQGQMTGAGFMSGPIRTNEKETYLLMKCPKIGLICRISLKNTF